MQPAYVRNSGGNGMENHRQFDSLLCLAATFQESQRWLSTQHEAGREQSFSSERWSATIVSSPSQIADLEPFVRTLSAEPGMLTPQFFLASVSAHQWRPHVVV